MIDSGEQPGSLKDEFALALLLEHNDPTRAAARVCPDNLWYCEFIVRTWPNDLYVMEARAALLEKYGEAFFLPSKYDIQHRLVIMMDTSPDPFARLRAIELFARINGDLQPNGGAVINNNIQNNNNNNVMLVKDHGTDADWEAKTITQQRALQLASE